MPVGEYGRKSIQPQRTSTRLIALVAVGAVCCFGAVGCDTLPGGEISCAEFRDQDFLTQEDIVDKALSQHDRTAEDHVDLTIITQHVRNDCAKTESATVGDLISAGAKSVTSSVQSPPPPKTETSAALPRTIPPPEPSVPPSFGYPAFYAAAVGDCVYYTKSESIEGMIHAACEDPRVNSTVTRRTLNPEDCSGGWVGSYEPQKDYSKPIPYELVLCLGPLVG